MLKQEEFLVVWIFIANFAANKSNTIIKNTQN